MSPAHVLEPTYDALRRRLVAGHWPPSCRLEAVRLAEELGVSITPVRDALNRLTGERLGLAQPASSGGSTDGALVSQAGGFAGADCADADPADNAIVSAAATRQRFAR